MKLNVESLFTLFFIKKSSKDQLPSNEQLMTSKMKAWDRLVLRGGLETGLVRSTDRSCVEVWRQTGLVWTSGDRSCKETCGERGLVRRSADRAGEGKEAWCKQGPLLCVAGEHLVVCWPCYTYRTGLSWPLHERGGGMMWGPIPQFEEVDRARQPRMVQTVTAISRFSTHQDEGQ